MILGMVESPVTQIAETEVKKASTQGLSTPSCAEIGNFKRSVPSTMMPKKLRTMIIIGERWFFFMKGDSFGRYTMGIYSFR
jgi:hypothetical protein